LYSGPFYQTTIPIVYSTISFNIMKRPQLYTKFYLANHQCPIFRKVIFWDLKVQRRRPLAYTSGNIVVRAVAGTKPSSVITSLSDGYAS
jgi:hypothetical protein